MLFLAEQHLAAAKLGVRLAAKHRGGICLDNFDWSSLTPDWSVVDEQVYRLPPPYIDGPPLIPDCGRQR